MKKMNWSPLVLAFLLVFLAAGIVVMDVYPIVQAASIIDSGTCGANGDELTWTLDENGLLVISGIGKMKDYSSSSLLSCAPWTSFLDSINRIQINDGVESIGKESFCYCHSLFSVSISDSVTSIGRAAFYACDSLEAITLPKRIRLIDESTFSYCTSLKSFVVPEETESIERDAFYKCSSLSIFNQ